MKQTTPDTETVTVKQVIELFRAMPPATLSLMNNVVVLLKLILVMPATNATSERSFSALRRLKTYLRSTMSQPRLNHLMLLHVHREETDNLNLEAVANDFVSLRQRETIFGKF